MFTIKPEVSAGDILTTLSIVISVIALLRAWANERQLRNKERSDRIRNAAAKTIAKLERWKELSLWYYQEVQPLFVEASEMLAKDFNIIATRDFMWKSLNSARIDIAKMILDEELEVAYVELFGYQPAVYDSFVSTITQLKALEEKAFNTFLEATQQDILSFKDHRDDYTSAMLGNVLRLTCGVHSTSFQIEIEVCLEPISKFLIGVILASDAMILRGERPLPNQQQSLPIGKPEPA